MTVSYVSVRLRVKTIFTLKYHPDRTLDVRDASMPEEHEFTVSSRSELEAMLALLGFSPAMRIYKERQTAHLGNREICLDEVEELGSFIEVEQFAKDGEDVEAISASLREFIASLGIPTEDIGVRRYDVQLLEKQFVYK
jgi:predicted adenylyl cyclase CyaB